MRIRQNIVSGGRWGETVGYARAVRVGDVVYVSGTTGVDGEGKVVGVGDVWAQTVQALKNIDAALLRAGATRRDVVRTRIYVTDIERWEEVGRAHGDFYRGVRPACTMVEVRRLIDPAMLVEIEAEAVVTGARSVRVRG